MSKIVLFTDQHQYYLYAGSVSMHKSFDSLTGLVERKLGKEVSDKEVFVFLNKERTHVKVLLHEARAYTLLYQRLHRGRFVWPSAGADGGSIRLTAIELQSLLQGLHLHTCKK